MKSGHDNTVLSGGEDPPLEEDAVLNYLLANPDFLLRYPEALVHATVPKRFDDSDSTVVDFQHVMLQRLQTEMTDLQTCAEELIMTTRSNMDSQKGTFDAVLVLLEAESVDDLKLTVSETLPLLLDIDICALRLEGPSPQTITRTTLDKVPLPKGFVDASFGEETDAILRPMVEGEGILYGANADSVRSDALVRIEPGEGLMPGVLALASRVEGTFNADMSIDLVVFLAKIIEHCLRRCPPESP